MTIDSQISNYLPNGFESWVETHYEVVTAMAYELSGEMDPKHRDTPMFDILREQGRGGLYTLAASLTYEFEILNKGRQWNGEFFEEIEEFLSDRL